MYTIEGLSESNENDIYWTVCWLEVLDMTSTCATFPMHYCQEEYISYNAINWVIARSSRMHYCVLNCTCTVRVFKEVVQEGTGHAPSNICAFLKTND